MCHRFVCIRRSSRRIDPRNVYRPASQDPELAVRDWIASRSLAQVVEGRGEMAAALRAVLEPKYVAMGFALDEVALRAFVLCGPLRQSMAELLKVEIDGQIALARARAEAATMRSLLNTARHVREHPKRLELRVLASGQRPRVTFVVGSAEGATDAGVDVTAEPTDQA